MGEKDVARLLPCTKEDERGGGGGGAAVVIRLQLRRAGKRSRASRDFAFIPSFPIRQAAECRLSSAAAMLLLLCKKGATSN